MDQSQNTNTQTPPSQTPGSNKSFLQNIEETLELYLNKKAPFHLPPNAKEILVKLSPWVSIILALVNLQAVLVLFKLNSYMSNFGPFGYRPYVGPGFYIGILLSLVSAIIYFLAFSPLQNRQIKGWRYLFYGALVAFVAGILGMNLIGSIVGLVINMYFVFQVKELYK